MSSLLHGAAAGAQLGFTLRKHTDMFSLTVGCWRRMSNTASSGFSLLSNLFRAGYRLGPKGPTQLSSTSKSAAVSVEHKEPNCSSGEVLGRKLQAKKALLSVKRIKATRGQ